MFPAGTITGWLFNLFALNELFWDRGLLVFSEVEPSAEMRKLATQNSAEIRDAVQEPMTEDHIPALAEIGVGQPFFATAFTDATRYE